MNKAAMIKSPEMANSNAMTPHKRLAAVKRFGMWWRIVE